LLRLYVRYIFASWCAATLADRTQIEWTDATWNPVRGCTKVSPGCKHCYAETFAERFRGVPGHPFEQGFDLRLVPEKLTLPLQWRAPRRIFVNSMSDLFHPEIPIEYVAEVGRVMREANWHTFQVLTKRHERMQKLLNRKLCWLGRLPNVWFGVSVEDREHGLLRIATLRHTNAALRFLSIEPLLEDLGPLNLSGIDWVIVGGESGSGHRPMAPEWATRIRDQCLHAGVSFFFKQWGGRTPKANGRELEGMTWSQLPNSPRVNPSGLAVSSP
jgi:protein gp37